MTIPGLIIINMLVGASVALSAKVQIKSLQRPLFYNRYFTSLLMLEVLIFLPIGMYYNGFYPDWSWMYLVDSRSIPFVLSIMALAAYPVAATMGYLVGYFSAKSVSDWVTIMFISFLFFGLVGLFVVGAEKIGQLGTYDQFHNNVNLKGWRETSLFPSIIVTWLGVLTAWGYILFRFWREGNRSAAATKK